MLSTLTLVAAIAAVPLLLVIATLVVFGSAVAGLADGAANGFIRPNPV